MEILAVVMVFHLTCACLNSLPGKTFRTSYTSTLTLAKQSNEYSHMAFNCPSM